MDNSLVGFCITVAAIVIILFPIAAVAMKIDKRKKEQKTITIDRLKNELKAGKRYTIDNDRYEMNYYK